MAVDKKVVDDQIAELGDFYQWFTKKERNYLHEVMTPGENIHAMTSGTLDGTTWLVTVTDKRVLFLDKGMIFGLNQMEMPLSHISAISHSTGLLYGNIEISTAGGMKSIRNIMKSDVPKVAHIISDLIDPTKKSAVHDTSINPDADFISQLERLAKLKDSGILTDDEFIQQKAKILSM
ncbi:MAG: PH domain-containing protein [Desulfuromonadales bacterium]|nr:PH domain-containing protein [Desulfuromonadales bacterium]